MTPAEKIALILRIRAFKIKFINSFHPCERPGMERKIDTVINAALFRIQIGAYGFCPKKGCGKKINSTDLKDNPLELMCREHRQCSRPLDEPLSDPINALSSHEEIVIRTLNYYR
ncbi:MAG: hypothetical protein US81_C0015G0014 [Parcubacteria group bacterium GW2011_GWE2_38_18]|nr:MAG: hypothetical protein US81_C0015G0014 [Parcubacteria group bacterium GW2011_GWE2_38_18]